MACVLSGSGWDRFEHHPARHHAAGGEDLYIVISVAPEAGAVTPVGSVVTQLMGALVAQGDGGSTTGALLRLVEQFVRPRPGGDGW